MSFQLLRHFLRGYLSHYVHLGICVVLWTMVAFESSGGTPDWRYIILAGAATWFVYAHTSGRQQQTPSSSAFHLPPVPGLLILILLGTGALLILWQHTAALLSLGAAAIITLLYFTPVKGLLPALKRHAITKILTLAFVYTTVCNSVPLLLAGKETSTVIMLALPRLLFVMALARIGEYRTPANGQKSISLRYISVTSFLLLASMLLDAWNALAFILTFAPCVGYILTSCLTWGVMFWRQKNQSAVFDLLIVDGTLALPLIIARLITL